MVKFALKGKRGKKGFQPRKRRAAAAAAKPTPAFTKKVQVVLKREEETKFVSENITDRQIVGQAAATPANLNRLYPQLAQGNGQTQRIGLRVQPTSAQACFTFYFPDENANNQSAIVNLWIVTVKGAKNQEAVDHQPSGEFLRIGNGNTVDPNDGDQTLMLTRYQHYPVNRERYTVLKHYRFIMRKGVGKQANQAGPSNTFAPTGTLANEGMRNIVYSWKPPTLIYPAAGATAASTLPTNHYPLALYYATNTDGSAYGDTIKVNMFSKLFYKDD